MIYKLLPVERETIILWNEGDDPVSITTCSQAIIAHMTKHFGPGICKSETPRKDSYYEWDFPKRHIQQILPKATRRLSEAQKGALVKARATKKGIVATEPSASRPL